MPELKPLLTGLVFGESPRWHDDRLWCIDMGAREVIALEIEGSSEIIVRVPTGLSAIDWLPDGRMLIAPWSGRHGPALDNQPAHLFQPRTTLRFRSFQGFSLPRVGQRDGQAVQRAHRVEDRRRLVGEIPGEGVGGARFAHEQQAARAECVEDSGERGVGISLVVERLPSMPMRPRFRPLSRRTCANLGADSMQCAYV